MATSEERREVAKRLRDYAGVGDFDTFSEFYTKLNEVLFESEVWFETDGEIFDCLADLIDPTCHAVLKHVVVDEWYRHTRITLTCSVCGIPLDKLFWARFCPNCGARVVSDDDASGD